MGSFGEGNFDNDAALDARQGVIDYLVSAIQEFLDSDEYCVEDTDSVLAYIDMLEVILKHTHCSEPEPEDPSLLVFLKNMGGPGGVSKQMVNQWKKKILQVYDDEIDELEPSPEHKTGRRKVIEQTFSHLLDFAEEEEEDDSEN